MDNSKDFTHKWIGENFNNGIPFGSGLDFDDIFKLMDAYANIQIELAVDKALSVFVSNGKDSLEFRTLRTQILNEIKDR